MTFNLTKDELRQKEDYTNRLAALATEIKLALSSYNKILQDAEEFRSSVESRLREAFDDKSEKWQNGDTGAAVGEMIDVWENLDFADVEVKLDNSEDLEAAPDGPSEVG